MLFLNVAATVMLASPFLVNAQSYKASFTEYGSGDQNGSPNCKTAVNACGNPTQGGFTAALSQQLFGVGPGQGAGPACNTCYQLTLQSDLSGNAVPGKSIKVTVNNLCPINGNPICNTPNQYGASANFDLCLDTGAPQALFTNGIKAGLGTATRVAC